MKKILSKTILFLFFTSYSFAASLDPLSNYLKQNMDSYGKDSITTSYVLNRCSAVYLFMAGITQDSRDGGKMSKFFVEAYEKYSMMSIQLLMKDRKWSKEIALKSVLENIDRMVKLYTEDGKQNFAKTGNYVMDTYIADDNKICNSLKL